MAYGRFDVPKEKLTLTGDQVFEYATAAERHYRPDYPYHNWNHALSVVSGIEAISTKLERRGLTIAKGALAVAAAWHDAGYHEDHRAKGFATKEAYSAALLDDYLTDKPVGEWERDMMLSAISATFAHHPEMRTPYDLILHRADIANIGGPTSEFLENSHLLWSESRLITGKPIAWIEHVHHAAQFIRSTALEHDHESLHHYLDTNDTTVDVYDLPFSIQALKNIEALEAHDEA